MEFTNASSSGSGRSSAIFKPSSGRPMLISAVVKPARGSRSSRSNAGRKNGSNRRSRWTNRVDVSASQFRKAEPVFAGGCGRLALDPKSAMVEGPCSGFRATMAVLEDFVNEKSVGGSRSLPPISGSPEHGLGIHIGISSLPLSPRPERCEARYN
jgi:hypothetical protein